MKFSYGTVFSLVIGLTVVSAASAAPSKPAKVITRVTRQGSTTSIVVHDYRKKTKRPKAVMATAPAVQWQEVDVRAPRLEAVRAAAPRRAEQPVTWTQSYQPGPVTCAAANTGGSFGGSILPTQPYYGFGNYGYGYSGFGFSGYGNYGYSNYGYARPGGQRGGFSPGRARCR
jgi:hypothetical protein